MDFFIDLLGLHTDKLLLYQMLARAFTVFFASLTFIRIAGIRTLGTRTTFDYITHVMLGAILGRAIVTGEQPFFSSLAAVLLIVLLQRLMSWLTYKSHRLGNLIKGRPLLLIKDGEFEEHNMRKSQLTRDDIDESLHIYLQSEDFAKIKNAWLERSGEISIIERKPDK